MYGYCFGEVFNVLGVEWDGWGLDKQRKRSGVMSALLWSTLDYIEWDSFNCQKKTPKTNGHTGQ